MAANVEKMAYTAGLPWHGLGERIEDADIFDIEKGIKSAGMDWEVGLKSLQTVDSEPVSHRACYRMSDNKILGVVGPRWTPVQNWDMFKWFQPFLDSRMCSIHTAGSLCGGSKVWVLCQITKDPLMTIAKNDDVAKFILLANSHDGTMAVRAGFTPVRVVCTNTLAASIKCAESKLIRIRHSTQVLQNMESIKDIMDVANSEFEATAAQYRYLASKSVHTGDLEKYVKVILGMDEVPKDDMTTRSTNIMGEIIKMVVEGKGQDNPAISGTYWQAYNGVSEYLNYIKGRNPSNRMDSLWFGSNATMNQKALDVAMKMAG